MKKNKVLVGLSGGVDSAVSALLLKNQGYEVVGVFMKIFDEKDMVFLKTKRKSGCYGPEEKDIEDVDRICKKIDIKYHIIDLRNEYKNIVLNYFKEEYKKGRTPNPCIICNRFIKFDLLIKKAFQSGIEFDFFATGHYAKIDYDKKRNRYILKKGKDFQKDQSYFLFLLTQEQLSKVIFPLGDFTKEEVKEMAKKFELPIYGKEESQDFITGDRFFIFENGVKEGKIFDTKGNFLGYHKGIIFYTIGQRKGIGISKGKPIYVVRIDGKENRIIVGEEKELYKNRIIAENVNFISIEKLQGQLKVEAKIRYKHIPSEAFIRPINGNKVEVIFKEPQRAPTPGQAVVFYKGDEVVGGGFILETF